MTEEYIEDMEPEELLAMHCVGLVGELTATAIYLPMKMAGDFNET